MIAMLTGTILPAETQICVSTIFHLMTDLSLRLVELL